MKIMGVVGARPNYMKIAPLMSAIRSHNSRLARNKDLPGTPVSPVLVHTGQHYDRALSDVFFEDLGLQKPDIFLGVGSASHAVQTAEIMKKFEPVLIEERPDFLIVVGDVNSTVACALVASKLPEAKRPLVAHVEAGLRSFDRNMPEEINRIITDHISDLLFVTETSGIENLKAEGISGERVHFVGNTMIDTLMSFREKSERSHIMKRLGISAAAPEYGLVTIHRPSNVDDRESFRSIIEALWRIAQRLPLIFPAHPRTMGHIRDFGFEEYFRHIDLNGPERNRSAVRVETGAISLTEPLSYLDFLCLMSHSKIVITDSGGIQEETTCLGVPCLTVRENTERPVTIIQGTNILAGTKVEGIMQAFAKQLGRKGKSSPPMHWDGRAAERILNLLIMHRG